MVSDDERREAAERLRDEVGCGSSWPGMERLGLILGIKREPRTGWEGRILTRLADLIDPPAKLYDSPDSSNCGVDVVREPAIDREALLALADKARKLGDEENGPASFAVRCTFRVFARSIYKALGEVVE